MARCVATMARRLNVKHEEVLEMETRMSGGDVALVSDAGTPGISDPGYYLINRAIEEGVQVVPIPGATAAMAAISASGLPTDSFVFEGFGVTACSSGRGF